MSSLVYRSPNFNARPEGCGIDTLVMHYTDTETAQDAIDILCSVERQVSAHYVVDEQGEVFCLVDETQRAWHAGKSYWRGKEGLNDSSIGIEIFNTGLQFGYVPFPKAQMEAVRDLGLAIIERHGIVPEQVVAHSDIAPARKKDPGELFDWKWLAEAGIGRWVDVPSNLSREALFVEGDMGDGVRALQEALGAFGYLVKLDGVFSTQTRFVVEAFQRHYIQDVVDGVWTAQEHFVLSMLNSD